MPGNIRDDLMTSLLGLESTRAVDIVVQVSRNFSLYVTVGLRENITATKTVTIRLANNSAVWTKFCISASQTRVFLTNKRCVTNRTNALGCVLWGLIGITQNT